MENDYYISAQKVGASFDSAAGEYNKYAVVQNMVLQRLLERLELLKLSGNRILDLGSGTGGAGKILRKHFSKAAIIETDLSRRMLLHSSNRGIFSGRKYHQVCADACSLPFPDNRFELVFTNLMLQWISDIERVFREIKRVLTPEGLVVFSSFGPATLVELRQSWATADDGIHVNAFYDMHDIGETLARTGLQEAVLDTENIVMQYRECRYLFNDLKKIGAGNAAQGRRKTLTGKRRFRGMINAYEGYRSGERLPATYEAIYGHAWNLAAGQGRPTSGTEHAVPLDQVTKSLREK